MKVISLFLNLFFIALLSISLIASAQSSDSKECQVGFDAAIDLQMEEPTEINTRKSYEALVCLAKQGNMEAKHEVFLTFYRTYPVLSDKAVEAFNFLAEAAREGVVDAQYNIGYLYSEGELVDKDENLATQWLVLASDNGSPDAAFLLGRNYTLWAGRERKRNDIKKENENHAKSIHFLQLAVDRKHVQAANLLGIKFLALGKSEEEINKGIKLLEQAAAQGDVDSMLELGKAYAIMFENTNNEELRKNSIQWLEKAARLGNVDAKKRLLDSH